MEERRKRGRPIKEEKKIRNREGDDLINRLLKAAKKKAEGSGAENDQENEKKAEASITANTITANTITMTIKIKRRKPIDSGAYNEKIKGQQP
jgi:hypothetical protein